MLESIVEQSLLFFPVALGIYISYGILRIPDLTTDGSFLLGGALFGISLHFGLHPILAVALATIGGILTGIVVSLLQTRLSLNPLIAGILFVFILNTLTLKMMGRPNLSLFDYPSIFDFHPKMLLLASLTAALMVVGGLLLTSRLGLMLHGFGNNPTLLNLSGRNADLYRMLGLSLSNGLVGYCGALTAEANCYVDIGMGTGVILTALGTVIIGEQFYRSLFSGYFSSPLIRIVCCLLGVFVYFCTIHLFIAFGLDPIYLRLMVGVFLIGFLAMTRIPEEKTA